MRAIFLSFCTTCALFASIGQVTAIRGDAYILRDNQSFKAKRSSELEINDSIKTAANALVQVKFTDNTRLTLGKNSILDINDYLLKGGDSRLNLSANTGSYRVVSGKIGKLARQNFKFKAQTVSIGIRGTEFVGEINGASSGKIACVKGAVDISLDGKTRRLNAGEQAEYELDRIMNLGDFRASDFDILQELGADYHEPKSSEEIINTQHKSFDNHSKPYDSRPIEEALSSSNQKDELDQIMGF